VLTFNARTLSRLVEKPQRKARPSTAPLQRVSPSDAKIEREKREQARKRSKIRYTVLVTTGSLPRADTDAEVFLRIHGTDCSTPSIKLSPTSTVMRDLFERGQVDKFVFDSIYVGVIEGISLRHDNSGEDPAWFCEKVKIVYEYEGHVFDVHIPCGQWHDALMGDRKISRDYYLGKQRKSNAGQLGPTGRVMGTAPRLVRKTPVAIGSTLPTRRTVRKMKTYCVRVVTGKVKGAGTDSEVYLQLYGANGNGEAVKLSKFSKITRDLFEQGQTDRFEFDYPDVGVLKRVRVTHDNAGDDPDWFLDKIIIQEQGQPAVFEFPCQKWLALHEGGTTTRVACELYVR